MSEHRRLSMSRTGRWVAIRHSGEIELVDLLGARSNRTLPELSGDFGFVGGELWGLERNRLYRVDPIELKQVAPALPLPAVPRALLAGHGHASAEAIAIGAPPVRVAVRGEMVEVEPLDEITPDEDAIALHGQRVFVAGRAALRAIDRGRELWRGAGVDGHVLAASVMFGGRAIAMLVRGDDGDGFRVLRTTGAPIHHVSVPRAEQWAIAEEIGHGFVVGADREMVRVDLRYGRVIASAPAPIAVAAIAVDQDGRHMVVLGEGADDAP